MKKAIPLLLLCLLLTGCLGGTLPFKNPLFTVTFGPLMTINVGEKNDTREIHAYGDEMASQAIASATEAIHIQVPAPAAPGGNNNEQSDHSRNLF